MAKRFCSFCGVGLEPFSHKQYCDDECAQRARRATDALRRAHDRESPPPGFQPFFGGRWESSGEVRALDRVSKYPPIDTIKNFEKLQKNSVYGRRDGVQIAKPGTYYGAGKDGMKALREVWEKAGRPSSLETGRPQGPSERLEAMETTTDDIEQHDPKCLFITAGGAPFNPATGVCEGCGKKTSRPLQTESAPHILLTQESLAHLLAYGTTSWFGPNRVSLSTEAYSGAKTLLADAKIGRDSLLRSGRPTEATLKTYADEFKRAMSSRDANEVRAAADRFAALGLLETHALLTKRANWLSAESDMVRFQKVSKDVDLECIRPDCNFQRTAGIVNGTKRGAECPGSGETGHDWRLAGYRKTYGLSVPAHDPTNTTILCTGCGERWSEENQSGYCRHYQHANRHPAHQTHVWKDYSQ